ncbi:2'-5' RNA ligase superfamily-domain-containing protein [Cladorrhinum sp. PSN332]|nr:2'-5' RNA ligase superfamily-domain-containing protein [Cladorrhinum sp. PSN332]
MAPSTSTDTTQPSFALTSHDTALAILPPPHLWPRIDHLRSLYDKAYLKWPPHINLLYPFIPPSSLDSLPTLPSQSSFNLTLDIPSVFEHKHSNTIYLTSSSAEQQEKVKELRRNVLKALGAQDGGGQQFKMHLTAAQSDDSASAAHKYLVEKVGNIPRFSWPVEELCILKRERNQDSGENVMKLWGRINIPTGELTKLEETDTFYGNNEEGEGEEVVVDETAQAHYYDEELDRWVPFRREDLPDDDDDDGDDKKELKVASYNVLAEFEYPPNKGRHPGLVKNILSKEAEADVVVLQEVTDGFLDALLKDEGIRETYPYCSHGPPGQDDIEPLPSFLNIAVLSKLPFDWECLNFKRKHKGAVLAKFQQQGLRKEVVLAAVHLSHGLTDGAVASKKGDVRRVISYLNEEHPESAWIVAGDFNLPTSKQTIQAALEKGNISENTVSHLESLDKIFEEAGLEDAGVGNGVTWNPEVNGLARALSGDSNVWPQRYDRIYVRGGGMLMIGRFNHFGNVEGEDGAGFASDHWGVRCLMEVGDFREPEPEKVVIQQPSEEIGKLVVPVDFQEPKGRLAEAGSVERCLTDLDVIPGEEETEVRKKALELLKSVILDTWATDGSNPKSQPAVVVVPVGSYALGVWTTSSDIDVLVIGPFTAHTFFSLAAKRLRKAAAQGIKILRRVRANTGTMLELDVSGIRMDLQFCPATSVAERWPEVLRAPASDPVWSLPSQTLNKLKAVRDIDHIQRNIPSLSTFRLAHRLIKTWAKSRGIYSARFGFLSGIQISILLTRVYKLLSLTRKTDDISVESLLTTFFAHYASFPFSTHQAFDPTFHATRIPYTRVPSREPLAILGYFPPMLNTATAASIPSVRALTNEFLLAHQSLSGSTTWQDFLTSPQAPFLTSFKTYISLSLQYWSLSPTKGLSYLGWFESRCVSLLVDLSRKAPSLHARIWPARFVEQAELDNPDEDTAKGRAYRGCYLIGLDKIDPANMSKEELKSSLAALRNVLPRFEETIRGDGKYFDPSTKWFSASLVNQAELNRMSLVLDKSEWAEQNAGEEEEEDDDDEEEELEEESYSNEDDDSDDRQEGESWEAAKRRRREKKKAEKLAANKRGVVAVADLRADKSKKFRMASDVINRIRWDASLDSGDFVVGYEDRFLGAQEKELDEWKGEQTDEEFIPQHRILYFKKKSDGHIVWDRRTRWDEVFENQGEGSR